MLDTLKIEHYLKWIFIYVTRKVNVFINKISSKQKRVRKPPKIILQGSIQIAVIPDTF